MATLPPPSGCTNFKLRQLTRRVSQHYDHHLALAGLKTTQYSLLSHIAKLGPLTLWGAVLYDQWPDRWTVIGALVIVGAGLYVWHREHRASGAPHS